MFNFIGIVYVKTLIKQHICMRNFYLSILVLFGLSIASCTRYYYKPNGVNVPLLTDAGDVHVDVNGSFNSETYNNGNSNAMNIIGVEASGSPLKHLGLMANYYSYNYTTTQPDALNGNINASAYLVDFGVGGYYAVGGGKIKMVVDMYGGWGLGNIRSDINADVTRMFLQPGISMRSPWFDVAFAPRIVNLGYSNFNANGHDQAYLESRGLIEQSGSRIDQRRYTFFEPSITMRAGYKFAKVQLQYVLSAPMSAMSWHHSPGRFSVGFYFSVEDVVSTIRNANPVQ